MALIRSGGWLASLAAVTTLASCSPRPDEAPTPAPPPAAPATPAIPVPPPAVNRAELLGAVNAAADAFAAGRPAPKVVQTLAGRRFSVRLPFGCLGPGGDGAANYAYDAEKSSLKLTARPQNWTDDAAIRDLVASPQTEAIEGFWITRPWLSTDVCPAVRPMPVPVAPAQDAAPAATKPAAPRKPAAAPAPVVTPAERQTVGLVSVFGAGASRLQQRGERPYEVVRKADTAPTGGFRLVLEGRIVEGPAGAGAIACRSDDPDRRPVCLVRVEFDRVAIESGAGELFGEWRS